VQSLSNAEADMQEYFFNRVQDFVLDQNEVHLSLPLATEVVFLFNFENSCYCW
jgi:hypothetical protein